MHFVGDIHQPLHASDDHDAGGYANKVKATGLVSGTLDVFCDTLIVKRLGLGPGTAGALAAAATPTQNRDVVRGALADRAREPFDIAKTHVRQAADVRH